MDHLYSFAAGLFGSACIQFNAVPGDLFVRGDFAKRDTISYAGVKRGTLLVRESQESSDSLRLRKW